MNPNSLPDLLCFSCPLEIQAANETRPTPRFSMTAYTGGTMNISGFPHPVVVDLQGLSIDRQHIPIRLDHSPQKGIGHTTEIAIVDHTVLAEGLISRDTSWARDVTQSGKNGFPWQASIGAEVIEAEFIPHGAAVQVNDQEFTGPLHVVRKARLKEISFVDNGADTQTSATIAAQAKENQPTMEPSNPPETKQDTQPTPETLTAAEQSLQDYRKQLAAETRRVEAIRTLCDGSFPELEAKAIEQGWDTNTTELHLLRASRPAAPAVHCSSPPATPQVFEAVAMMSAGLPSHSLEASYGESVLEAADKLRGVGVQEFCELACGQRLPRFRRDATGWLQAAFSTASLPGILSNIANKMLLEGYNYVEDAWRRICKVASVNDFKEHTRYRMTGGFKFLQVGADGELKHGKIDEQTFKQKADTHGIMFSLTRQMIINDDMSAFTDIPRQIGMGAAEAIADAVWGLLLSNPAQSDGKPFFHAEHKNYLAGADTTLDIDGLTKAEVTFCQQIKPNKRPLGISPSLLLVPIALKVIAEQLMKSLSVNEAAAKAKPATNPHVGKFDVVSSSYLSNASFSGCSSKAWYLLADPNRLPALEVAFLNGVDRPTVEKTDADFNTLGIQFRGYIDFGVREQDYRGALKMKGEA